MLPDSIPFYVILALSAFLISLLGTRLTILALRQRTPRPDIQTLRGKKEAPALTGGGVALVVALMICLLVADMSPIIILPLVLLATVSLLDDLISVPGLARLVAQLVAVGLTLAITPVPEWLLPVWFLKLLIGIVWIWFINVFTLMDSVDGMSAAEMIVVGAGLCLTAVFADAFPSPLSIYGIIVACAACGFLWWNWNPSKISLGSVGTVPIGFLLGYLLVLGVTSGYGYAVAILPAYYVADGAITFFRRIRQEKKAWVTHSEHYHQQAVHQGRPERLVTLLVCGVNILLVFLATKTVIDDGYAMLYVSLAYLSVFMLLGFFAYDRSDPGHAI